MKKEMNVEQNFYTYLKAKFGKDEEIIYEKLRSTGRLDIYFPKRKIGVEIKMVRGIGDLDRLVGQIRRYKNDYDYMCVVLVNIKGYPESRLNEAIQEIKEVKASGNVEVIIK